MKTNKEFLKYAQEQERLGDCQYLFKINGVTVLVDANNYSRGCVCVLSTHYIGSDGEVRKLTLETDSQPFQGTEAFCAFEHLLKIEASGEFSFVEGGSAFERCKINRKKYNSIMEL